ncbi:M23 family metallopeptidase [Streptomyces flavidovirens]|uniref:M23 family metallopeptidase n=1 Tax=Streptomyces flavidovirens TaxID=67298 RepID=UPI00048AD8CC|nr:M23 family metallopeptidase [Streptomyces flavidovirens]
MASNRPAPEATLPPYGAPDHTGNYMGAEGTWEEWNPTEDSVRPVRGRHRVAKQRGGLGRSSTVLGVGVIAAVGAGGIATAQDKPAISISLPDAIADSRPDPNSLPGVGSLMSDDAESGSGAQAGTANQAVVAASPLTTAGVTTADAQQGTTDAGEALRARILQQAEQQQAAADAEVQVAAEQEAAEKAAAEAKKQQSAAEAKEAEEKREAEEKKRKAEEEAERKAEEQRLAELAASYSLPTSSYTLTSTYGQSGSMWSSGQHTGLDFAAPTGTPVKAVHGGTIKSAGWSGSYGYRIVLELPDGTEVWYCHLSSMTVTSGEVGTGDVIGRVGATGNVTGPHLHLEVHTPGGAGVDPAAWLRGKGLSV